MSASSDKESSGLVVLSFATIYIVWGSTYLAIKYAIESIPPFLMAGWRFLLAGMLLYPLVRWRHQPAPTLRNWAAAALTGTLMLVGGNGLVCWAEQTVPSGLAALLIATVPLWMVLLDWSVFRGTRPTLRILAGLTVGLIGVSLLIGRSGLGDQQSVNPLGAAALLGACMSWSLGSLFSRRTQLPRSALVSVAMQMLCAGVVLTLIGTAAGEWRRVSLAAISFKSWLAVAYLAVFGSIAALSAYVWLLRVCSAARVATYAYVNPLVALLLGTLENEPLTPAIGAAAALIVTAVVLVNTGRRSPSPPPAAERGRPATSPAAAVTSCRIAEE